MGRIGASSQITNIPDDKEKFRYIQLFLDQAAQQFNGNVEILQNLKGKFITVTFPSANQNLSVVHGLGFVPNGYIVCGKSAALSVYDGNGATNTEVISLKCSAVATAKLFIF